MSAAARTTATEAATEAAEVRRVNTQMEVLAREAVADCFAAEQDLQGVAVAVEVMVTGGHEGWQEEAAAAERLAYAGCQRAYSRGVVAKAWALAHPEPTALTARPDAAAQEALRDVALVAAAEADVATTFIALAAARARFQAAEEALAQTQQAVAGNEAAVAPARAQAGAAMDADLDAARAGRGC